MKKILSFITVLVLVIAMSGCGNSNSNENVLTVDDIKSDPLSFTGEITITGVNVGVFPDDPKIFFLMDTNELIACKNMECGAFQLPVIYKGYSPIPELADEVNVTGKWGKYQAGDKPSVDIFEINKIAVKRNIMSQLQ